MADDDGIVSMWRDDIIVGDTTPGVVDAYTIAVRHATGWDPPPSADWMAARPDLRFTAEAVALNDRLRAALATLDAVLVDLSAASGVPIERLRHGYEEEG